jgi:hypothetical protein
MPPLSRPFPHSLRPNIIASVVVETRNTGFYVTCIWHIVRLILSKSGFFSLKPDISFFYYFNRPHDSQKK